MKTYKVTAAAALALILAMPAFAATHRIVTAETNNQHFAEAEGGQDRIRNADAEGGQDRIRNAAAEAPEGRFATASADNSVESFQSA